MNTVKPKHVIDFMREHQIHCMYLGSSRVEFGMLKSGSYDYEKEMLILTSDDITPRAFTQHTRHWVMFALAARDASLVWDANEVDWLQSLGDDDVTQTQPMYDRLRRVADKLYAFLGDVLFAHLLSGEYFLDPDASSQPVPESDKW